MIEVCGASVAVLVDRADGQHDILVYRRDETDTIPYPGKIDLPGGGMEPGEDVIDCGRRETWEEIHVQLSRQQIGYIALYPRAKGTAKNAFLVAHVKQEDIMTMEIGDEGFDCQQITVDSFLNSPDTIIDHKDRLRDYFNRTSTIGEIMLSDVQLGEQAASLITA